MTQVRNKQIKFDSNLNFTTLRKVTNLADGTATNDAVNKGQLTAVEALIGTLEWQDSVITALNYIKTTAGAPTTTGATTGEQLLNTNNNRLYTSTAGDTWNAGVVQVLGARYIFRLSGTGTGAGIVATANNNIYKSDGSVITFTAPTTGMFVAQDDLTDRLFLYTGAAWSERYFEVTTASTGLVKVGFDIRLDPTSAIFIEAAQDAVGAAVTNSARVTLTYSDAGNTVTADLVLNTITEGYLSGLGVGTLGQVATSNGALGFSWVASTTLKDTEKRTVNVSAVTVGNAQLSVTDIFGAFDPRTEAFPSVYINGSFINIAENDAARTTAEGYFGNVVGTAIAVTALAGTENFYFNGTVAGYDLDATDTVTVHFTV